MSIFRVLLTSWWRMSSMSALLWRRPDRMLPRIQMLTVSRRMSTGKSL